MNTSSMGGPGLNRLRLVGAMLSLLAVCGVADAAVTYRYSGPMQSYASGDPGYGGLPAGRLSGTATFDDALVTSNFTGTLYELSPRQPFLTRTFPGPTYETPLIGTLSSDIGFAGSSSVNFNRGEDFFPAFSLWNAFFFTFSNGQVVDWFVGGHFNDIGAGGYYVTTAAGDSMTRYRVMSGPGSYSLAGESGSWTREGVPSAVPLPLSLPLLAMGLAGLGVLGRRKVSGQKAG